MFFFNNEDSYIAIIGDIKKSKCLDDRCKTQEILNQTLEEINNKYTEDIASKFIVTLGDEFQGLLCSGKNAFNIIEEIKMKLYPVRLRFGVGIGKITTEINSEMALGADGPAYYNARDAVAFLKSNEKTRKPVPLDICFKAEPHCKEKEISINTIMSLMNSIESKWTDRQREIIWDMLTHNDEQKNIAERLGIKQPTVQKAIVAGNGYTYENAVKNIEKLLGEREYD